MSDPTAPPEPNPPAPQRPEPEADGLSELAEFWKGEYIKAVDILDRATNALTDSIMASGNDARTNMHWVNKMRRGLEELRGSAPPPVAAQPCQVCNQFHGATSSACPGPDPLGFSPERLAQGEADVAAGRVVPFDQVVDRLRVAAQPDPFCPQHGPARASNHAAAGCTCRPVPPSPPPPEAKRFHSGEQVMEHYVPGYQRPAPEPSPYAPPPEADVEALPPGLLILIDKADDWLEASKLANRDYATEQHGTAADLKRKAFVEFIHASVRENPKTLQTGLSLLRSLSRRLQEAHLREQQAHAAGVALGREQAAKVKALLARLERMIRNESEDVTYGGFCGGDPREFSCDPECSTEEERAFHATDCAAWDAWEAAGKQGDPPAPSVKHGREIKQLGDGSVMSVKYAGYGLGTCRWVDYDRRALADELAAAIRALGPQAAGTGEGKE